MSDIFREVDEDVRRAQFEAIWKKHGNLIVALALLVVAASAGWQLYGHVRAKQAERASSKFQAAIEASIGGRPAEAEPLLASVMKKGPAGYALLARFREAAETGKRDAAAGVALYDALAGDPSIDAPQRDLARLRAAMLLADTISAADLAKRVEPLATPANPWRNLARELLGLANLKDGDHDAAGRYFDAIVTDPQTSGDLRQRVDIYLGLVKAGPLPKS